ncbi:uncharacterized protein LOC123313776 [Coccinella septempunctata]|uniref:uncharacterized protein LOC123313776 n=1 Tax=Coccinella septempunctata TaxID=41139 RepID=UPI001D0899FC|nr:uncharacterized protein LOC123313776 [Coccinella septempunctata]
MEFHDYVEAVAEIIANLDELSGSSDAEKMKKSRKRRKKISHQGLDFNLGYIRMIVHIPIEVGVELFMTFYQFPMDTKNKEKMELVVHFRKMSYLWRGWNSVQRMRRMWNSWCKKQQKLLHITSTLGTSRNIS